MTLPAATNNWTWDLVFDKLCLKIEWQCPPDYPEPASPVPRPRKLKFKIKRTAHCIDIKAMSTAILDCISDVPGLQQLLASPPPQAIVDMDALQQRMPADIEDAVNTFLERVDGLWPTAPTMRSEFTLAVDTSEQGEIVQVRFRPDIVVRFQPALQFGTAHNVLSASELKSYRATHDRMLQQLEEFWEADGEARAFLHIDGKVSYMYNEKFHHLEYLPLALCHVLDTAGYSPATRTDAVPTCNGNAHIYGGHAINSQPGSLTANLVVGGRRVYPALYSRPFGTTRDGQLFHHGPQYQHARMLAIMAMRTQTIGRIRNDTRGPGNVVEPLYGGDSDIAAMGGYVDAPGNTDSEYADAQMSDDSDDTNLYEVVSEEDREMELYDPPPAPHHGYATRSGTAGHRRP